MAETATKEDAKDEHTDASGHHVVPAKVFHAVFIALLVLTVVTYLASTVHMGRTINIVVALAIAVLKASLVATFFMHLKWDKPFNTVILLVSVGFLALFLGVATLDTSENEWRKDPGYAEKWMKNQRRVQSLTYSEKKDLGGPPASGESGH